MGGIDFGLIDEDTPQEAWTYTSLQTGESWELVFSDEFEVDGRTFWPGDDPYWCAFSFLFFFSSSISYHLFWTDG